MSGKSLVTFSGTLDRRPSSWVVWLLWEGNQVSVWVVVGLRPLPTACVSVQ